MKLPELVPPRTVPQFERMPANGAGVQSGRPGSMDYRDFPSLIGGKRVAYHVKSNGVEPGKDEAR